MYYLNVELDAIRILYAWLPGGLDRPTLEDGRQHRNQSIDKDKPSKDVEYQVKMAIHEYPAIQEQARKLDASDCWVVEALQSRALPNTAGLIRQAKNCSSPQADAA